MPIMPQNPFDPESTFWLVQNESGGMYGTLVDCLKHMFYNYPGLPPYERAWERCLSIGYVSINGQTICFITQSGESTL